MENKSLQKIENIEVANMDDDVLNAILNEASGVKTRIKFETICFKAKNKEFVVGTDKVDDDDKRIYKKIEEPIVQILKIRKKVQNKIDDDTFYSNEFDGDRVTIYGKEKEVIYSGGIWGILGRNATRPELKERFSSVAVVYVYALFNLEGKAEEGYFKMYLSWAQEKELNNHINSLNGKALALYPVKLGFGTRMKAAKGEETRPATATEIKKFEDEISEKKVPGANIFYSLKISLIKQGEGYYQADPNKTIIKVKNILQYIEAIREMVEGDDNVEKVGQDEALRRTTDITPSEPVKEDTEEEAQKTVDAGMNAVGMGEEGMNANKPQVDEVEQAVDEKTKV